MFFNTLGTQINGITTYAYQKGKWVQQGTSISTGTTPDWTQITQSTLFQNEGWQKEPPVQTAIAVIFMTTLPYLARYSPNLALATLSWYNQQHVSNPKVFQWHPGDNLAVVMNFILQNRVANEKDSSWKDPVSTAEMAQIKTVLFSMMGQSDHNSFPQNSSERRGH